ncbi:MAG: type II toxin-antitoxin system HicB family antitoxin [Lachnospiraceae bacterium]|nr:type II toxin-antitoxin system HicB family antitoxin [Lachnospiraceae bacterium]
MAKYIFPAIFAPDEKGMFSIRFPDVDGCFTCGDNLEHGMNMANDALSLMLVEMEDKGREIPVASGINDLKMNKDEFATLISVDTTVYRHTLNNMAVKKTLSIPQYLNQAAIAAGINFSQVLQDALKEKLGMANLV